MDDARLGGKGAERSRQPVVEARAALVPAPSPMEQPLQPDGEGDEPTSPGIISRAPPSLDDFVTRETAVPDGDEPPPPNKSTDSR